MLAALDIQKDAPRYISAEMACQRLGVDEATLLEMIRAGSVRVAIMGELVMVEEDSLPIPIELPLPTAAAGESPDSAAAQINEPSAEGTTDEPDTDLPVENLPSYISLEEAAQKYPLQMDELRQLLKDGKIKGAMIDGALMVDEKTLPLRKEDLPEYKKFSELANKVVWISLAERKYGVPNPTISRWVKAGIIRKVGMDGNRILLNEQDVAYCAEIYHRQGGQGKRIFAPDGTPYQRKK